MELFLDNFSSIESLECGYKYGIFRDEDIKKAFEEYNIDEYSEAFSPSNLIDDELLLDKEVKDYDTIVRILENLGISKKNS